MLFIENPYLKEFDAKIVNINSNQITLDQTAFYARSGGQPGDVGKLTINGVTINIIDTIKDQENNTIHIAENNITKINDFSGFEYEGFKWDGEAFIKKEG